MDTGWQGRLVIATYAYLQASGKLILHEAPELQHHLDYFFGLSTVNNPVKHVVVIPFLLQIYYVAVQIDEHWFFVVMVQQYTALRQLYDPASGLRLNNLPLWTLVPSKHIHIVDTQVKTRLLVENSIMYLQARRLREGDATAQLALFLW